MLHDKFESILSGNRDSNEMGNIINKLNMIAGSFGVERKNLVNSLFKTIIEVSFPNYVQYLFLGSSETKFIKEEAIPAAPVEANSDLDDKKDEKQHVRT